MSYTKNPFVIILLYVAFISGISPLHNIAAGLEHFPYGILLILAFGKLNYRSLILMALLTAIYGISLVYYRTPLNLETVTGLIQMLNFTAPLFFIRGNEALIARVAENVFWIYIGVGILQALHLLVPFEPIMELFISRFHGGPVGGYRGVTMLETEPARAGFQLLMLYVVAMMFRPRRPRAMTIMLIISEFALISSTTGIILTTVYFSIAAAPWVFRRVKALVVLAILAGALVYFGAEHPKIALMAEFYRANGLQGLYTALAAISGGRFLASVETIGEIINWPMGHGAHPDFVLGDKIETNEFDVADYTTRVSARPVSAIQQYLYYFGVIMLLPLWIAIRRNVPSVVLTPQALATLVIGMLYTPPASEIWMIAFCLSLRPMSDWQPRRPAEPRKVLRPDPLPEG